MVEAIGPVSAGMLLDLADRGARESPMERALAVAAASGADAEELRDAPLGLLHAAVIGFHAVLAGPRLEAVATCPGCAAVVEFGLDVGALGSLGPALRAGTFAFRDAPGDADYEVRWRTPSPDDLAAAAEQPDAASALLARCADVRVDDRTVPPSDLPAELVDRLERELAAADPLAEISADVDCPACGAAFSADVDPGAFVWAEVEAAARRVLAEVDALARAYGWSEPDVLALPEARRAAYLSLVREGG